MVVATGKSFPTLAELHLGVRLDRVEQLGYQFTLGLTEYGLHSTTLITSAGRISGQPYQRYTLDQPTDVDTTARQMMDFMDAAGFDFLNKYGTLQALDKLFNNQPTEKSLFLVNPLHRSLRGIILAKLTQRNAWEQLVDTYRTQLVRRGTPEPLIYRYDRLVDYLRTFSVN